MLQHIGRYEIIERIAAGGQATVYRARDAQLGRVIALKVMHPHLAGDPGYLERFMREARMAASLSHPNVAVIYEVGEQDAAHFIAMEFVPSSLDALLKEKGRLTWTEARPIMRQVAEALRAASRQGIVHRDHAFYGDATVGPAYDLTLQELTGVDFYAEARPWNAAMEWLGRNLDTYQPPEGYLEWKAALLSLIDPRMGSFFTDDPTPVRIDRTEVVRGGMRTDAIPDLRDPPAVEAAEASFMHADDRVFGVSIDGEHRAYPLRIVNAHEMANEWLGGVPIALAY